MTTPSHLVCFMFSTPIYIIDVSLAAAKGQYIKQANLAGFAVYEEGGDYNNILLNAINGAMA